MTIREILEIIINGINNATGAFKDVEKSAGGMGKAVEGINDLMIKTSASVIAVAATMKKAFELGREGAAINQLNASFTMLLSTIGAAPDLLEELMAASKQTIDDEEIMAATTRMLAGTQGELAQSFAAASPKLMEMAKAANKLNPELGSTISLYEGISVGIKNLMPRQLKQMGIVVDMSLEQAKYAESIGKTAEELTVEEQQQALLNAVLEQSRTLLEQVGGNTDSATDSFDQLNTTVGELKDTILEGLAPALSRAAEALNLLITANEQIEDAILDHAGAVSETTSTYEDYEAELRRAAEAAHLMIDENGDLIRVNVRGGSVVKEVVQVNYLLTEAEYENVQATNAAAEATDNLTWLQNTMSAAAREAIKTFDLQSGKVNLLKSDFVAYGKGLKDVTQETKAQIEATYALGLAQDALDAGLTGRLNESLADYNEIVRMAVAENEQLTAQYLILQSQGISETAEEMINLKDKIEANNQAQVEALEGMRKMTAEMIYQQAAQGLSAAEALGLAREMGLIDEQSYAVSMAIQQLIKDFDANQDGMISAAEGANQYAAAIAHLNAEVQNLIGQGLPVTGAALSGLTGFASSSTAAAGTSGGGFSAAPGGGSFNFTYAPYISTASQAEAEMVLRPIIERIIAGRI